VHLGVVVTNYPPRMGGVEVHVEALAGELSRRGHQVTVVCLGDNLHDLSDEVRDGVRVLTLPRRLDVSGVLALPRPVDWRQAVDQLAQSGLTHVSVHTRYFPMTWLGLRVARRLGVTAVLTEHGGGYVAASSRTVTAAARAVDRTAGRRSLRRADQVLAVSARSADFVRQLAGRSAPVLGNGTDTGFWGAGPVSPRRHLLFAGRLVREKGWPTFLDVAADVPADVTASVAGDGPDRLAVERTVGSLGLSERVQLVGRLGREPLRRAYAGSVYVNPSTAAEGFQTTLLEAGLAGARIATYDVGGAAEVVGSGGAPGRVVPVGDEVALRGAVRELLDTDELADHDLLQRYDWSAVADRYVAELETVRR
jgi:glycosyltransferase involved in cell wall biosynthesis